MIIRGTITGEKLEHIYKTIHNVITSQECYYSDEELKEMKKEKNNIFIERRD